MRNERWRNLHSGRQFFGVTLFVHWPIGQRKLLNKNQTIWTKFWRRAQKLGIIIEKNSVEYIIIYWKR